MVKIMSKVAIRIRSSWIVLSLTIVTMLILAACGGTTETPTSPSTSAATPTAAASPTSATGTTMAVKIVEKDNKYSFEPATLTITKGTQITWTNASDAPHMVTSDTGAFNTPDNLTGNKTFTMVFNTAGTFNYHCDIHPYMKATITVTG
ncbi:MAG: cupredoxin domain-containing protein [Chloroflexota bacterium]|nr:cupredoxin domain-containing protein [Chloroflexota bacterium]